MDKISVAETLIESTRTYFEFILNDKPLPKIFAEVYEHWSSVPPILDDSLIGVLNSVHSPDLQTLRVKQLIREKITRKTLNKLYPQTITSSKSAIRRHLKEINSNSVLLYCCPCGDEYCPGISVEISSEEDCVIWSFDHLLQFRFNKKQYLEVFNTYLKEMNHSS